MIRSVIFLGVMAPFVFVIDLRAQSTEVPKANGCPVTSVTGPAGLHKPGDMIWFEVSVTPETLPNLSYRWTVNEGQINEGQSSKKIGVRYLDEMRATTLTATVEVGGIPDNCERSASESAPLVWEPVVVLISDFSVPIGTINPTKLREAAIEYAKWPNDQMYIIEYFPPGTTERAVKRKRDKIMAFMVGVMKMYGPSVTIVDGEAGKPMTKIYRVPHGTPNPTP
jgi:hypothetical protein